MTLPAVFAFAALNQALKTGSNVTVLLAGLHMQASPAVVGALIATGSLLPALLAVSIGRLNDRFGSRLPMFVGSSCSTAALLLPVVWPTLPALFISTIITGLCCTAFSVSSQSSVGFFGDSEDRSRNFSWLSLSFSSGSVVGPMLAGFMIDNSGHSSAFLVLAFLAVPAMLTMGSGRLALPSPRSPSAAPKETGARFGRMFDLLRGKELRIIYLLTALHVSAWEVFSFLVPVYGSSIGLAATSIGLILGAFSSATFLVRLFLPYIARRWPGLKLIRFSISFAAAMYIFFPMVTSVPLLIVLAFILGVDLGVTQPLAMQVLHECSPPGRIGEAVGLRSATVNFTVATTPLLYGAAGGALGMMPVFWGVALLLWFAVWRLR